MSGVPKIGRQVWRGWGGGGGGNNPEGRRGTSPTRSTSQPGTPRPWRLSTFVRRKLSPIGGWRVSSGRGQRQVGVAASGSGFGGYRSPSRAFGDPAKDQLKDPLRGSDRSYRSPKASYTEPQIHDVGGCREPRYLDLFEPGVSVIRDPRLDEPDPRRSERVQAAVRNTLSSIASTRTIIGCGLLLLVLVIGITAILATSKYRYSFPPNDPRVKPPRVTTVTSCGKVEGIVERRSFAFRGVPYAVPPLGVKRFRKSKYHDSLLECWTGTYFANDSRQCWGYDSQGATLKGHEDCLLLDVFTPQLGYDDPLPVVVYIGGISLGGDERRQWLLSGVPNVVADRRTVFVAPQIRRGVLGFTPHPLVAESSYPHSAGNQGASDLYSALKWVQINIEHFGGDPNRVTLLGHQAGASLVWSMLGSHKLRGVIQGAWLTGAATVHPKLTWRDTHPFHARPLNCSTLTCLQTVHSRTVMETSSLDWRRPYGRPWLVTDGVFVPFFSSPPNVPTVVGSPEQASAEQLHPWKSRISHRGVVEDALIETLREIDEHNEDSPETRRLPYRHRRVLFGINEAAAAIRWYSSLASDHWLMLTTMVTDATTTCPLLATAAAMSRDFALNRPTSKSEDSAVITGRLFPNIYSYVAKHRRYSRLGTVADGLSDIEAILGSYQTQTEADRNYVRTVQDMFYLFAELGAPERYTPTPAHLGVYVIGEELEVERSRPECQHWANRTQLARYY